MDHHFQFWSSNPALSLDIWLVSICVFVYEESRSIWGREFCRRGRWLKYAWWAELEKDLVCLSFLNDDEWVQGSEKVTKSSMLKWLSGCFRLLTKYHTPDKNLQLQINWLKASFDSFIHNWRKPHRNGILTAKWIIYICSACTPIIQPLCTCLNLHSLPNTAACLPQGMHKQLKAINTSYLFVRNLKCLNVTVFPIT